jgi:YfiH family protein
MELIERENSFTIGGHDFPPAISGFTKNTLKGVIPPDDIKKALSFLKNDFGICWLNQIHTANVHIVDKPGLYQGDGLFTSAAKLVLIVKTADCMPIFFYEEGGNTVGLVHMGWRSANEGILGNISFDLSRFKVVAGVGLRKCCYTVGKEFPGYPGLEPFVEEKNGAFHFDPVAFARRNLVMRGLKEENFFDINICSVCSGSKFFSYRKGDISYRTLSFIVKGCIIKGQKTLEIV